MNSIVSHRLHGPSASVPIIFISPSTSYPCHRADELAKEATELEPATETTTIAKLHRQLRAKMKAEWTIEWARKPIAGRYAISDRTPPSLAGSHAFRTLDRRILGIVTQARTGHGHFGEYYQTYNIQGPTNCPCGAGLQTREHIGVRMPIARGVRRYNRRRSTRPPTSNPLRHKDRHRCLGRICQKKQGLPENTSRRDPLEDSRCRLSDQRSRRPARPDRNPTRSTSPNENLTLKARERR